MNVIRNILCIAAALIASIVPAVARAQGTTAERPELKVYLRLPHLGEAMTFGARMARPSAESFSVDSVIRDLPDKLVVVDPKATCCLEANLWCLGFANDR